MWNCIITITGPQKMEYEPLGNGRYRGRGVYITTKMYGIEGHTYTLDIYYKGRTSYSHRNNDP